MTQNTPAIDLVKLEKAVRNWKGFEASPKGGTHINNGVLGIFIEAAVAYLAQQQQQPATDAKRAEAERRVLAVRGSYDAPGFDACVEEELRLMQQQSLVVPDGYVAVPIKDLKDVLNEHYQMADMARSAASLRLIQLLKPATSSDGANNV